MPIYVYRCNACGEVFEKLVSFSKTGEPQPCKVCSSRDTEKQLARVNTSRAKSPEDNCATCPVNGGYS